MQLFFRSPVFAKIYHDHKDTTQNDFLRIMFAMSDKVFKSSKVVETFKPELAAIKKNYPNFLDFEQQQDAFEFFDLILLKIHACIRIESIVTDVNMFQTQSETLDQFVQRRCVGFFHAQDNSTIYDQCAILTTQTDICQHCVNCVQRCSCSKQDTTLSRDRSVQLSITPNQMFVSYAFLEINGDEKDVGQFYIEDENIIDNNKFKDLLKLIIRQQHPEHNIQDSDITNKKFSVDQKHYMYFVTCAWLQNGTICAVGIDEGIPTVLRLVYSNTNVIVIQEIPAQYSLAIPIAISSYVNAKHKYPLIIPCYIFVYKDNDTQDCTFDDVLNKMYELIDKRFQIRLNHPLRHVFYVCHYETVHNHWDLERWDLFMSSSSGLISASDKKRLMDKLTNTTNTLVGISCGLKYKVIVFLLVVRL